MRTFALAAILASLFCAVSVRAAPPTIAVTGAWSRATPPGAPTAAGYLTIANHGGGVDRLISADSPTAASVSVHQMSMTGGIMRMRPVAGGLAIAPGGSVSLDPQGDHLMFEGLKRPFTSGEQVPAVLHFQRAGAVQVTFLVR